MCLIGSMHRNSIHASLLESLQNFTICVFSLEQVKLVTCLKAALGNTKY